MLVGLELVTEHHRVLVHPPPLPKRGGGVGGGINHVNVIRVPGD